MHALTRACARAHTHTHTHTRTHTHTYTHAHTHTHTRTHTHTKHAYTKLICTNSQTLTKHTQTHISTHATQKHSHYTNTHTHRHVNVYIIHTHYTHKLTCTYWQSHTYIHWLTDSYLLSRWMTYAHYYLLMLIGCARTHARTWCTHARTRLYTQYEPENMQTTPTLQCLQSIFINTRPLSKHISVSFYETIYRSVTVTLRN